MKRTLRLNEKDLTNLVKRIVNENREEKRHISRIVDDIVHSFEFSEKGNDELITLANYLLTPEGAENVAKSIFNNLKRGFGAHQDDEQGFGVYTSKRDDLSNLENRFGRK